LWGIKPLEQTRQDFSGQELLLEVQKVPTPQRNCSPTALNYASVDAPRLMIPVPRVHHHVADEAHMKRVGDAASKGLGVILRVCINGLSRLAAGNAGNGARKRPRPPLTIKPGLRPGPLFPVETVVALQSLLLRLMNTNYTRIGRQCHLLNEIKQLYQLVPHIISSGAGQPGREFFDKK
jgi:hypothetical protein